MAVVMPLELAVRGGIGGSVMSRSAMPRLVCVSRAYCGAVATRLLSPPALVPSYQWPEQPPVELCVPNLMTLRHVECYNLWQLDGLSIRQIQSKVKLKEQTIFNCLIVCMRNGLRVDWFDICKEAGLTYASAMVLERAHQQVRSSKECLKRYAPSFTDEQCSLFRTMKDLKLDTDAIFFISKSAWLPEGQLEAIKSGIRDNRLKIIEERIG